MPNETIAVFVIVGVALLDAALFLAFYLQFRRRKAKVRQQAFDLAEKCLKELSGVEPSLANQVTLSPRVEFCRCGYLPWQKKFYLVIMIKDVPHHKLEPLVMTLHESVKDYLDLPEHKHLWARIEPT